MALVGLYGSKRALIGPPITLGTTPPNASSTIIDAANESIAHIGRIETSDGGSHTIDTTGSSSIGWRSDGVTFANAGTTFKVGIGAVIDTAGPPARAANAADVITFDVAAVFTGGGGGVTANAWQTSVPTTGTKTIANGDLVAVSMQMTARGGADTIAVAGALGSAFHRPVTTQFTGGAYSLVTGIPSVFITFADGATGWIQGGWVFSGLNARTFNSGSATKEYGQLYKLPFPTKVYGLYGWADPDNNFDFILYSDPLGGSPVAERTCTIDANVVAIANGRYFEEFFTSPYTTTADQVIGAVFKPGASNISAYYKTLSAAGHRVSDPCGTEGYGISRASGAFANANSSLDHYYVGLILGAFDNGVSTSPVSRIISAQRGAPY